MAVSTFNSLFIKPENSQAYEEYDLEDVKIRDKTKGVAIITLLKKDEENGYQPLIKGKKVTFPTVLNPALLDSPFFYMEKSKQITLKFEQTFLKITEIDANGKTKYYVNVKGFGVRNCAYYAFPYMPKEIKLEEANEKLQALSKKNPDFKWVVAAFNSHGVVASRLNEKNQYEIYWANPEEEHMQFIECLDQDLLRNGGSIKALSADGHLYFQCQIPLCFSDESMNISGEFFINHEKATELKLPK
jgi:hypothetical protein